MKRLTVQHIPAQGGSPAQVRVSYYPAPDAEAQVRECEFDFAVTEEERRLIQWYLEEYLIYPWGEFRTRAAQVEQLITDLGKKLFHAVFGDEETSRLYTHIADHLDETRIVIHAGDPEGISIPWELMRDPAHGEYGDLARLAHAFVRSELDLSFEPPPPPKGDTFNILMVICRPAGPDKDVPFQSVARPLLELMRPHRDRINIDVLRPPTFEQLTKVLGERPNHYHVVHFDGHGTFPEGEDTSDQGRLFFEGELGFPRQVTGEELGRLLAGKGVPLVILNACQSGMTRPESLYPSIGNQLLKARTSGVVAMAYSVYVQTAVRFMRRLYEGLINGEELSRAMALAREDLCSHPQRMSPIGEIKLQDWVVPVLFESSPIRVVEKPAGISLSADILKDEQAKAGAEIECPEPPAFGFVGRDGVILELERAFEKETVVLLQGMAGIGKTEAAMGFARWRAETGGLDGPIFFFRFEHYLPLIRVLDGVGQAFGPTIKQQLGCEWHLLEPDQRRKLAVDILKKVPCLMVWDNFEPVAGFPTGSESAWETEEQKELRDFLRDLCGGKTKVLVTSRRDEPWLGEFYRRVEVGGLKLPEAQELAIRVLLRAGLNAAQIEELPEYNKLLEYLQGNPLAIQVILPELKRMKPDALLRDLQAGEATLGEDDPKQGRERSLAASLTYRLDTLDPTLRKRLGILGRFHGCVGAHVLAVMCDVEGAPELIGGLDREDWARMLHVAAEAGLLRHAEKGYYAVHPALPWFFLDLRREAFPDQEEWFESAFSSAYGALGEYLFTLFQTNAQLAMSLLRAEEDNLTTALATARRREQWNSVGGVLYGLRMLLGTQGRWVEWKRMIIDLEAEIADQSGEPLPGREGLWRAVLGHRAEIAVSARDFSEAESTLPRLKKYYEHAGDERNTAAVLQQLGWVAREQRRFDEAESWCRQSLAIEERIGNEHGQAQSLHQLGMIAEERRQFDEAENLYRQSLAMKERIGDEHGQAATFHQLGRIAQERRRFDEAKNWYRQSLAIEERTGDEHAQAITAHQLGTIALERRRFDEAEDWYRQSLAVNARIRNEHGQAGTLHQLGIVAQERRRFDEAEDWYRQSLATKERIGDEWGQATTVYQLGRITEERGNTEVAVELYVQAEEVFSRLDDPHNLAIVRESLERVRGKK